MSSSAGMVKTGTYIGTGVALDVPVPFRKIEKVKIVSVTEDAISEHQADDTDATCIQTSGATVIAAIATNGITLGEGKFTVGTNAKINTDGSVYRYEVFE